MVNEIFIGGPLLEKSACPQHRSILTRLALSSPSLFDILNRLFPSLQYSIYNSLKVKSASHILIVHLHLYNRDQVDVLRPTNGGHMGPTEVLHIIDLPDSCFSIKTNKN
jgi:hypothetical protein